MFIITIISSINIHITIIGIIIIIIIIMNIIIIRRALAFAGADGAVKSRAGQHVRNTNNTNNKYSDT